MSATNDNTPDLTDEVKELTERTVKALETVHKDVSVVFLGVTSACYFYLELLLEKNDLEEAAWFVEGLRDVINSYEGRMKS